MKLDFEKIRSYGSLELMARQMVDGFITGLHKSPYHGFSVEFAEHRLYNNGESTRHIDWKVFAKTDRLYTRRYEEETNLRCMILMDSSPSMYYPEKIHSKLSFGIVASAALSYLLQRQRDAVGLTIFSDQVKSITQAKSTVRHTQLLIGQLAALANEPIKQTDPTSTSVSGAIHEIAQRIQKRSLVVIFSDMFNRNNDWDSIFQSLLHLKHQKHEVLLFHILDEDHEVQLDFPDRQTIFIDAETKLQVKVNPFYLREQYTAAVAKRIKELKMKCGQYKIDFTQVNVSLDKTMRNEEGLRKKIHQTLMAFLQKRARMN